MNDALVGVPYVEEVDACLACRLARLDDEGATARHARFVPAARKRIDDVVHRAEDA